MKSSGEFGSYRTVPTLQEIRIFSNLQSQPINVRSVQDLGEISNPRKGLVHNDCPGVEYYIGNGKVGLDVELR